MQFNFLNPHNGKFTWFLKFWFRHSFYLFKKWKMGKKVKKNFRIVCEDCQCWVEEFDGKSWVGVSVIKNETEIKEVAKSFINQEISKQLNRKIIKF